MSKVMLIDGHSLAYRAFHALPTDLTTASGQVTNAVYGFTSMLLNLMRDHEPDGVAVAFDRREPTFRKKRAPGYKATRSPPPDILVQQLGLVRQVVDTLGISAVDHAGVEADDIIATLATQARDRGDEVIVVTGDRDVYQLVEDPHIKVLYNKRGVSEYALYDEDGIRKRTGVAPKDYVAYAALRGDTSDNLPGVPGVGEKTAAKLINTYGDIDSLYEHVEEQTPKLRKSLAESEEQVRLNAELMVLLRDVETGLSPDDLQLGRPDPEAVHELFQFLEFRQLLDRLAEIPAFDLTINETPTQELEVVEETVETPAAAVQLLTEIIATDGPVVLEPGWDAPVNKPPPADAELLGVAVVRDLAAGKVAWLPVELLSDPEVAEALDGLLAGTTLVMHDAKPFTRWRLEHDKDVTGLALDTHIAAYLLNPGKESYHLGKLLETHVDVRLPDETPEEGQLDLMAEQVPPSLTFGRRALAVACLVEPLQEALAESGMQELNEDMEVPLVRVLARMELVGIAVEEDELKRLRDKLAAQAESLRATVVELAGEEFNVNSPQQLSRILYEKLGLPPTKRNRRGYSTDAATLEKLREKHPIVPALLDYREVEKLRSTYGEGLLEAVGDDGRIHATFKQTVARTGRLSSDAPNLHNIPVRSETGRVFRTVFVAKPDCELLVADYNQIELRCIAHLAEDPGLIEAFESGQDIHTATAAQVLGLNPDDVGPEERSTAKMVSYGLAYGMEAYGLGQRLNISTEEAAEFLDAYFKAFPAVKSYMEHTVATARERGYTETLFGRRRRIPELHADNHRVRQAAERQAMNAGIQGLAADIFKVALVRLDAALDAGDYESRIILQVHDEVILEVPQQEMQPMAELTTGVMSEAYKLRVPLAVNLSSGRTWADAK